MGWSVLLQAQRVNSSGGQAPDTGRGVTVDIFEEQLGVWAPRTAIHALRDQFLEQFGSLGKGQRALKHAGLRTKAPLSPMSLNAGLQAVGIASCDVGRITEAVSCTRYGVSQRGRVTFEDLFAAMRAQSEEVGAHRLVRNAISPTWQQLHQVQADLLRGESQPS